MQFDVGYYPEKNNELLTVRALDLVYAEGCPLLIASWIASGYNEEKAIKIIDIITETYKDWFRMLEWQTRRNIKNIKTKIDILKLLDILRRNKSWKELPTKLHVDLFENL